MKNKFWSQPKIELKSFEANEYVAACGLTTSGKTVKFSDDLKAQVLYQYDEKTGKYEEKQVYTDAPANFTEVKTNSAITYNDYTNGGPSGDKCYLNQDGTGLIAWHIHITPNGNASN